MKTTNEAIFDNRKVNRAYNSPAESLVATESYDAVYLDPPYFSAGRERARSDYRFLYHFLEGLANYGRWGDLIDRNDIRFALKREYNEDSAYKVPPDKLAGVLLQWFRAVLTPWQDSTIIMSYKHPGTPTKSQLRDLLKEFSTNVSIYERPYAYALNRSNGKPGENIELLLVAD